MISEPADEHPAAACPCVAFAPVADPVIASTSEMTAALAALPDPVFILRAVRDPDGVVVELTYAFLNEAAARLYGRRVAEILGHGQCELFPSVIELGIFAAYLEVIRSGEPTSFEVPAFDESGVEGSFELAASKFGDGVLVRALDVTRRRRAERSLAETDRFHRLLAENTCDIVVLARPDGTITWVSPGVTDAIGWSPDELVGTSVADRVHPDDLAALAPERSALLAGQSVTTPTGGLMLRLRTKSGQWRWMSERVATVPEIAGEHLGIVASLRDVDDLVRDRQDALTRHAHLRTTVDSLLDPHVLLAAVHDSAGAIVDFRYLDANPAACADNRLTYAELIGSTLLDRLPGHAGSSVFASYRRVVETGEPLVVDDTVYVQELLGGLERRYDTRAARAGDGLSLTWRDVTERHAAKERRDLFLSHVSHELRSPLSVVHQFASLLVDGVGGPVTDDQEELLSVVMRNVHQLKMMIDDLLEVGRAERGHLTVECRPVALGDVLAASCAGAVWSANARQIALRVEHRDLPPVFSDPERLQEVLTNLLDNALKFTPSGGEIVVDAVACGDDVRVTVRDTGRGMLQEDALHIFEQFFQVEHDGEESRNGLGLGLFICRDLIRQQGGTIWAESTPGQGTTLTFTVPICAEPLEVTPADGATRADPSHGRTGCR